MSNPYGGDEHAYGDYGGTKGNGDHVVWQGPPDDMIHGNEQDAHDAIGSAMADEGGGTTPEVGAGRPQDYEYEQQRQLDAERVETQQAEAAFTGDTLHPPHDQDVVSSVSTPYEEPGNLNSPWEPLNVKRDHAADPESMTLRDANLGPPISVATTDTDHTAQPAGHTPHTVTSPTSIDLPPPPTSFRNGMPSVSTPGDGDGGFYTPLEGPTLEQAPVAFPESRPIPAGVPVGGRISAAAFRRAKPRTSLDHDEAGSPLSPMLRRLPVPPLRPETPVDAGVALAASPSIASEDYGYRFGHGHVWKVEQDAQSFADAKEEASPPPVNGGDSLR